MLQISKAFSPATQAQNYSKLKIFPGIGPVPLGKEKLKHGEVAGSTKFRGAVMYRTNKQIIGIYSSSSSDLSKSSDFSLKMTLLWIS